ncbi:hypothetical protein RIF29_27482 [Crotalaria pallida]|uniref:Uncharacterized protein n=1 Tax=Crotalaria pallida TaxID=3830 RepID=A0AAN9EPN4_CROPI
MESGSINKYKYVHLCTPSSPTLEPYSSFSPIAAFSFRGSGNLIAAAWCCYVAATALNRIGEDDSGNGGGTDLS